MRVRVHLSALVCAMLFTGAAFGQNYQQHNLVSDIPGLADHTDANLVNPWGLTRSSTGPWWISDNGKGVSTLYNGSGGAIPLVVTVPAGNIHGTGVPTGAVFNGSTSFELTPHNPAVFIFVTEDGTVSGWNPKVDPTNAVIKVNLPHSVFKGATIAAIGHALYLYVADFHNGAILVFDTNFVRVPQNSDSFKDPHIPHGFAPFNVQNIGGNLYVSYAKQDEDGGDDVPGPGLGYVDVFTPQGKLIQRLEHGDWLNAPWGLALAPYDFGSFSHAVLVGQFGSGQIAAYDYITGAFLGLLEDPNGHTISIDGLWALSFGNSATAGPYNVLFFTAGINDENDGLFGTLTPLTSQLIQGSDQ
jgi:uncharacterized protein (TIGR03118 family)